MAQPAPLEYFFEPALFRAGDLKSYTAPAINEKMKALGSNYFGDVICRNAYPVSDSFLAYGWSNENTTSKEFELLTTGFTERTWKYDISVYGGLSGGAGVSLFGVGAEMEFSMLVGETYSNEKSSSQLKSSGWSLKIDEEWGPLPALEEGGPDDAVDGYTFRAYFLPVPKPPSTVPQSYWTTELINILPSKEGTRRGDIVQQMVDPNSGSWRIVFVVTSIEYRSQTIKDYVHDSSLDRVSVYADGAWGLKAVPQPPPAGVVQVPDRRASTGSSLAARRAG